MKISNRVLQVLASAISLCALGACDVSADPAPGAARTPAIEKSADSGLTPEARAARGEPFPLDSGTYPPDWQQEKHTRR